MPDNESTVELESELFADGTAADSSVRNRCNKGSKYASVFPLPVSAAIMVSAPTKNDGKFKRLFQLDPHKLPVRITGKDFI